MLCIWLLGYIKIPLPVPLLRGGFENSFEFLKICLCGEESFRCKLFCAIVLCEVKMNDSKVLLMCVLANVFQINYKNLIVETLNKYEYMFYAFKHTTFVWRYFILRHYKIKPSLVSSRKQRKQRAINNKKQRALLKIWLA